MIGAVKGLLFFLFLFGVAWVSTFHGGVALGLVNPGPESKFLTGLLSLGIASILTVEAGSRGALR